MTEIDFDSAFAALTGYPPFPWQRDLYESWFREGQFPQSCNLPTGLGKTSVIAVWLIALATNPAVVPRRLVYVVNRRTVVDQTTEEVEKYRRNLANAPAVCAALEGLCAIRPGTTGKQDPPLAISTLRGQFADNREWSADPSRPAVICGTVDMIGSRLLFSGYGCGFRTRPLHAGFLGQDALLVHDEAHLEPAFQELLLAIEAEQARCKDFRPLRVMELTATSRNGGESFELTKEEKNPPETIPDPPTEPIHRVWRRLRSKKGLRFHESKRADVAKTIGLTARRWKASDKAILVFVRTIDDVKTVQDVLTDKREGVPSRQVQLLTGTLRGLERDRLASEDPVFARFLPDPKGTPQPGTVYLVCTSAGEVGVDISSDHMVCDLTTLDSMAQRLGRVNRRGDGAAEIDVVVESDPDPKPKSPEFEAARWVTKAILERLPACGWITERREASPLCLRHLNLTDDERQAAFAPTPTILPVSDILFDAWALTTIRDRLPGRPPVEPYLHGLAEWQPPETHVAWREEVGRVVGPLLESYPPKDLLEAFPLKPHELLRDNAGRVHDRLKKLKAEANTPVWVMDDDGSVNITTLGAVVEAGKDALAFRTVLLPPSAGGLTNGMLDPSSTTAVDDVADRWLNEKDEQRRVRVWDEEKDDIADGMRLVLTIDTKPDAEEQDESTVKRYWHWYELRVGGDGEGLKNSKLPVLWEVHTKDVVKNTTDIVGKLPLGDLGNALVVAAECHDLGKRRKVFQRVLGNLKPDVWLAKSGAKGGRVEELYRHEFGSLIDAARHDKFAGLKDEFKEFVLHVIAAHHGRGRPHFPADEAFDPERPHADAERAARETPRRFARLQRKYGRWGLAYLESLLRAGDYAASANPSAFVKGGE